MKKTHKELLILILKLKISFCFIIYLFNLIFFFGFLLCKFILNINKVIFMLYRGSQAAVQGQTRYPRGKPRIQHISAERQDL